MKRNITTFIFIYLALCNVNAQTADTTDFPPVPIGAWRQHLPWQRARSVAQSAQHVYFATEWAVAQIDKSDAGRTPRYLTKIEGLSDAGIEFIRFNRTTNTLAIAYTNSNLDLWSATDGRTTNLPFILRNTNLAGRRKLNDMMFEGSNAYLAGAFGLLKLDLIRREVVYTTFSDEPALSVTIYNNFIYLGTLEGLFRLPVNDSNPADFGRWQLVSGQQGIPASGAVSALAVSQGQLFFSIGRTVYQFNGTTTSVLVTDPAFNVVYLSGEGEGLVVGYRQGFSGRMVYRNATGALRNIQSTCDANIPMYSIEDGRGRFWIADLTEDFRYYDLAQDRCERFRFNSPFNEFSTEIAFQGDRVYVATPGTDITFNPRYGFWGIYIYENGQWRRFNGDTNPNLKEGDCDRDWWRIAPHPTIPDKFYVGSFIGGLVEATKDGAITRCFNQNNSILQSAGASGANRTAIGGMAFDKAGNLWIGNYDARSPIAVLKPDGKLQQFATAGQPGNFVRVAIDDNNNKWFAVTFNGGVLVYDSGKDLAATNDDRYRQLTSTNSQLPSNIVNCIVPDLDGNVWVGTQQGVVIFDCDIFNPNCVGSRRPINIDGFNAYLLETEDVRAIAVDGANRKWCGTTNGIFVLSSDGKTELARITRSNSPLFDNTITAMAANPKTGELWIGTEKGMQSIRTEATVGGRINSPGAYAYPNPVPPDYDGPIAIYGLARDANVKITDITGNLVYEGTALGGQAVWNGRDYLGRRVASGMYLIYATSNTLFDTPDAMIVKVVVLR